MTALRLYRAAAPLGLVAALTLGLTAAMAQTPPAVGAPPAASGMHRPDGQMMRQHRREGMEKRHAEMIADWTTVLKLTPSQAQALQTAMMPPQHGEHARSDRRAGEAIAGGGDETTLQRLDRMQSRMNEREGHMREHLAAMRAFYTSLSSDQQKSFDGLTRLTHRGMDRRRHGMWGGHHGMGGRQGMGGPGERQGPPPAGE